MTRKHIVSLTILILAGIVTFHAVFFDEAGNADVDRWRLPKALREVSGLAVSDPQHVLTVTDEMAVVYSVDLSSGAVETTLRFGSPPVKGDFEGIALGPVGVFLITSDGLLYRSRGEPAPDGTTEYDEFDTGLGDVCEIEGLTWDDDALLILCKNNYLEADKHKLLIYRYVPGEKAASRFAEWPTERIAGGKRLTASGIYSNPNYIYIVDAKRKLFLLFGRDGSLVLSKSLHGHHQAEGIVMMPGGSVVIADEGKDGGGTITRYGRITGID
ncbi:MAG: hypothetical protein KDI19_11030 [Pseudomonadales bacterium]|nr:hypothetical protein [Pseudomonadales bacterium]